MTLSFVEAKFPFTCPTCGLDTRIYFRGQTPCFIPNSHCAHAISVARINGDPVVTFARDELE